MLDTVNSIANWVFGVLFVWVLVTLAGENLKELARQKGWNHILVRCIRSPQLQIVIPGWQKLRERWWLWLSMGISFGVAASLWLVASFPQANSRVSPSAVIEAPPRLSAPQAPSPPQKFYSQKQKNELSDMIQSMLSTIDREEKTLVEKFRVAGIPIKALSMMHNLTVLPARQQVQRTIEALIDITAIARGYNEKLGKLVTDHPFYKEEISSIELHSLIMQLSLLASEAETIQPAIASLRSQMDKYPDGLELHNQLLRTAPQLGLLARAFDAVQDVSQTVKHRAEDLRSALRQNGSATN